MDDGEASKPAPPELQKCFEPKNEAPKLIEDGGDMSLNGSIFSGYDEDPTLCLPLPRWTVLASLIASCFIFLGLLAASLSELPDFLPSDRLRLPLRVVAWAFLFYIPIMVVSAPLVRNYVLWGLKPGRGLQDAWPDSRERHRCVQMLRSWGLPLLLHVVWGTIYAALICIPVRHGEDHDHLGIFIVYIAGNVLCMLSAILLCSRLGPPAGSKRYAFSSGPMCVFVPIFGFAAVSVTYTQLRRVAGFWLGILMPLMLCMYEFLGTLLVSKLFTRNFLIKQKVRERYAGTNQGIVVSTAICNLHALAEGARLTLLYNENLENPSFTILVPMVSGVLCNVMVRMGCIDRFLHIISCKRWRPNNCCKLLRESGYCMGYPRFGAFGALLLVRLCIGTALSWSSPEILLLLGILLSEVLEDLLSCALWRLNLNVSPRDCSLTESQVVEVARRRLFSSKLSAILPESPDCAVAPPVKSDEHLPTVQWKVRVMDEFTYGPEAFGKLPFWAHLLPTALAQFHTILALMVLSTHGPWYVLGLCCHQHGEDFSLLWWSTVHSRCEG